MGELRAADLATVRSQLGREPTVPFSVVVRCPGGHPLVIRNAPGDADGAPFPTLYWLTCPEAVRAVSRLESRGRIAEVNARFDTDEAFATDVVRAHEAYARERARYGPGAEAAGGVGGTRRGIKCLHAHYANHLAGGFDPVGDLVAAEVEPPHGSWPLGRVAGVDQGTNSIRLLILEADGAELGRDMVITRLGYGVDRTGRIDPAALARTAEVLDRYHRRAEAIGTERIRVCATSAVRDADNRAEYVRVVREVAGVDLEILTGEEEAALSFAGAVGGLDAPGPWCVLDIGGGSTEFVLGGAEGVHEARSTQMGSVRLTERHIRTDPPGADELEAMRADVAATLDEVASLAMSGATTLVSVAGTATTMQAVSLELDRYDPDLIHRSTLTREAAEAVRDRLAAMSNAQRAALPVMAPGRADVIVAGAVVLTEVMRRWGFAETLVSEHDILDGLTAGMLGPSR